MQRLRLIGIVVVLLVFMGIPTEPVVRAHGSRADVVYEWNQLLQQTLPASAALLGPRYYSIMHIAMFDAINSIEREHTPYRVRIRHEGGGGSAQAAAAQAAHDVLTALIGPNQLYEDALAARLGDHLSHWERRGARLGARVAEEVLAWRQTDGWATPVPPPPPYTNPLLPGLWQPTAAGQVAAFTHLQFAAPMALLTSTQFLPPSPPSLTSAQYTADFNEVKLVGKSDSAFRTAEQTLTARLWAGIPAFTSTNLFSIWNNIATDAARGTDLSLAETARLFVLMNVSIHDSLMTTQVSKFVYGLWRPITAIQNAGSDLNPDTAADPTWTTLIPTPPYPAYAGNMTTVGTSAATALALVFGRNDIEVSARWQTPSGVPVVHTFPGFREVAEEQAMSRIWGGIHYRFDQVAGAAVGERVGAFVFQNYVQPRNRWDHGDDDN
jgi:hypothetical protein